MCVCVHLMTSVCGFANVYSKKATVAFIIVIIIIIIVDICLYRTYTNTYPNMLCICACTCTCLDVCTRPLLFIPKYANVFARFCVCD